MHTFEGNDRSRRYLLLVASLLIVLFIVSGCSLGDASSPIATPTLVGLFVPDAKTGSDTGQVGGGAVQETATAIIYAPTVPTPSTPNATEQSRAEETTWVERATETAARTSIPVPIGTNEATVEPAAVGMDTAWDATSLMQEVPVTPDDSSMFIFHSVDPNGKFVVGVIVPRMLGGSPAKLVMLDAKSGQITRIAEYTGPDGGEIFVAPASSSLLFSSDTDGETVVWNEWWAVRAYTISTGAIRTLVERPASTNAPFAPAFLAPKIDHGVAVWREYASVKPSTAVAPSRIIRADLATGDVTELSSYGTEPTVSWPFAGWVEYPREGEGVNSLTFYYKGVITLLNLETGAKTSLDNIAGAATFGLTKNALVYSRTSSQAFISDLNGSSSRLISGAFSSPYPSISMNNRIATWITYPPMVYDRAQDRRIYLNRPAYPGAFPGSAVRLVKGHILAWQTVGTDFEMEGAHRGDILPNNQLVILVDTDKLPMSK